MVPVLCNGRRFDVTDNLHVAFIYHVAFMGDVYCHAKKVLVCFGKDVDGGAEDVASLAYEVSGMVRQHSTIAEIPRLTSRDPLPDDVRWNAVVTMYNLPWLNRAWVIQEVGLAQDLPVLYCGVGFSYRDFVKLAKWCMECAPILEVKFGLSFSIHALWGDWSDNWCERSLYPDSTPFIVEVGPRDGLQNEKTIPLATKIELIERLAKAGLTTIEAGAFVSPKWVPQHDIPSRVPLIFSFLAPNTKGRERATAILSRDPKSFTRESQRTPPSEDPPYPKAGPRNSRLRRHTESFSHRNLNCSIVDSLTRFSAVIAAAKDADLRVRAYISVVLGCPFEGPAVDPHRVATLATELLGMGADSFSLGDTTGVGTAPWDCGAADLPAQCGAPGPRGNVATEDVVYFLESLGIDTWVDLDAVAEVGAWIMGEVGKPHGGSIGKALLAAKARERAKKEGSGA
ncbi:hypothetical protein B0H67DRAFT_639317 [Lasiosphaeris hirsuta]|uniref:Hydroxymethylglutaryl-CoA lyase n=1 Tax=Lasiosphaeris hirsuta TaxID=260670 RepID=A0AA40BB99_9PEZI|nr:hypothetical protein B0H67DRAFT_639317 [Lasiosphaeris hirsuta]